MTENEAPRPDQQPPQPPTPAPQAEAPLASAPPASSPEAPAQQPPAQPQFPEAAPTDLRRNVWLLIIILGVVVVAWVFSLLSKPTPPAEPAEPADAGPPAAQAGAPAPALPMAPARPAASALAVAPAQVPAAPGAAVPASPAADASAQAEAAASGAEAVMPMVVVGSDRVYLLGSPAQRAGQDGTGIRVPRLFDVSQRAKAFDPSQMLHLAGRWAEQRTALGVAGRTEESFQPAATLTTMQDDDRVVVLTVGTETHVYPANLLAVLSGVTDVVGGRRVFVNWSPVTQLARCLVAKVDDKPIDWVDAGMVYRSNEVMFDAGTGSLWDVATGLALAGPMAEKTAEILPVQVCLWGPWKAAHPDSSVLNPPGATLDKDVGKRIETYLASPAVPVPLPQSVAPQSPLPLKDFVLGLSAGGQSRAYDLRTLFTAGQTSLKDTLGTQEFEITVTSARTATATSAGKPVDASVMLWFGWKQLHADTTVYGAAPAAPTVGPQTTVGQQQPAQGAPPSAATAK